MNDSTAPGSSTPASIRWIAICLHDPSNLATYQHFRRRLRGYMRHAGAVYTLSMDRIGLCHRDGRAGHIDELLLLKWLREQPELRSADKVERMDHAHCPTPPRGR